MGIYPNVLHRALSEALEDRLGRVPVVVVTGARQTGKTTLLQSRKHDPEREMITLDSLADLDRARGAPDSLFRPGRTYAIDEVQRAPELLLAVKRVVDRDRRPGSFILTGSSNLLLMKGVSETLAGRTANLTMRPMTSRELRGDEGPPPWRALVGAGDAEAALSALPQARAAWDWREAAVRGGLPPAALAATDDDRALWFENYVETYVQRDLRDLAQIGDLPAFVRLVRLAALRTGGLINYADLASDSGLPRTTVQRWVSLLEVSYLATVLAPFAASKSKRLIKTAKLYGLDSGLGLHLCGVDSISGAAGGALGAEPGWSNSSSTTCWRGVTSSCESPVSSSIARRRERRSTSSSNMAVASCRSK